jgi:1-acyl-sn-glycerol-3-phosphate acyltransferase
VAHPPTEGTRRASARRPEDGPPWAWRLVLGAVLWLLRRVYGWRVRARRPEVVPPPDQPLVVVFNHTSAIDAFLVADTVWRGLGHWVQPLIKAELFDVIGLGFLARRTGAIPVTRAEVTGREAAYGAAVQRLRAGGTLLLAPEGTVTHDGSLLPFRIGAARLALDAGVAVLVVTHFGAQRGFSPVARRPERDVVVTMTFDLLSPSPDEDATSLTGRMAATMLDRSAELQAAYPQATRPPRGGRRTRPRARRPRPPGRASSATRRAWWRRSPTPASGPSKLPSRRDTAWRSSPTRPASWPRRRRSGPSR